MLKHIHPEKPHCRGNKAIALALAAALGGSVLLASPAQALSVGNQPAEPQVIEFDLKLHGSVTETEAVEIQIPSACHDGGIGVTVRVSDEYEGREHRSPQLDESVVVEMWRGDALVADVGPTPDLPDGIRSASVQTDLGALPVPAAGDVVVVRMSNPDESYGNSVVIDEVSLAPICKPPVETVERVVEVERIVEVEKVVEVERVSEETFTTCEAGILGVVARMYESYFDRRPDRPGLLFWSGQLGHGMELQQLSELFEQSPEFTSLHPSLTDEEFVEVIYSNALHRKAEPAGLAFWVDQLAEGKTRGWVVTAIAVQPESLQSGCYAR